MFTSRSSIPLNHSKKKILYVNLDKLESSGFLIVSDYIAGKDIMKIICTSQIIRRTIVSDP